MTSDGRSVLGQAVGPAWRTSGTRADQRTSYRVHPPASPPAGQTKVVLPPADKRRPIRRSAWQASRLRPSSSYRRAAQAPGRQPGSTPGRRTGWWASSRRRVLRGAQLIALIPRPPGRWRVSPVQAQADPRCRAAGRAALGAGWSTTACGFSPAQAEPWTDSPAGPGRQGVPAGDPDDLHGGTGQIVTRTERWL